MTKYENASTAIFLSDRDNFIKPTFQCFDLSNRNFYPADTPPGKKPRALIEGLTESRVHFVDFDIRGFYLAFALMDGYDVTIFVDATPRGGQPGALYVIEPDLNEFENADAQMMAVEPHGMNPMKVLQMARSMGAEFKRILLIGCEPETFGPVCGSATPQAVRGRELEVVALEIES